MEACENKYNGFGACSSTTINSSFGIDFATFDMDSMLSELHRKHAKSDNNTEVSNHEDTNVVKLNCVKQHIHKVHSNLHNHTYPAGFSVKTSADVGWMLNINAVESMNIHLIHKLMLWQKGHTSYTAKVVSSNELPGTVAYHQTTFVETLVHRAIVGIMQCNIPVWLMSEDRMIEIIDGIDTLCVAQFVKNTASYDQFIFESHLSICAQHLYVATVHHGYIFDHIPRDYFLGVFYGIDYDSHVIHAHS